MKNRDSMKKLFKNKINIFLIALLLLTGGFSIIWSVTATDKTVAKVILEKGDTDLSRLYDIDELIKEANTQIVSGLPNYALRADGDDNPMGWTDSSVVRCFIDMGPVEFGPRYKYRSHEANNDERSRMYGFSTPLVGDLNGDGKPEIVALGIRDGEGGLNATATYIYILNGQTGHIILKFHLPLSWNLRGNYYHGSPCQLALMKLDKDSNYSQIVCALGYDGNNDWSKRVVCWRTNDITFDSNVSPTENSKLTFEWKSDVRYDAYGTGNSQVSNSGRDYSKPLPHVVNLDGKGDPEIIVYNKIYNARDGKLIMKLDDLASSSGNATAYVGQNRVAGNGDSDIPFAYIYDIDFDGKYDVIAGGKVYYDINLDTKTYKTIVMPGIGDGYTAVADVNDDGLPEVVMASYPSSVDNITVNVWTPNLVTKDASGAILPGTKQPELLATRSFRTSATSTGNHSNIFIGDIDGQVQNGKKFPEITILSGNPNLGIGFHPNWIGTKPTVLRGDGALFSLTWDDTETNPQNRLKLSFILEHEDRSYNTGFTFFDFDNDGVQDVCYRDMQTLRIISARKSYVALTEKDPSVIRFEEVVRSYTGFENPVVADVDGDASADMIVMGRPTSSNADFSYIYAVEGKNTDLTPAPRVWNQYSYSPLKVNEDLTIPTTVFHPLDDKLAFYKSDEDKVKGIKTYIYNNTITQIPTYSVNEEGIVKPIVRTPDANLFDLSIDIDGKKLNFKVTNIGDATVHSETPITIYKESQLYKTFVIGSGGLYLGDTIKYSESIDDPLALYTITVGGTLDSEGVLVPAQGYNDCDWANNVDEVATFLPKNDAATVIQYGTTSIDVFANDIFLDACAVQKLTPEVITTPGGKGVMSGSFGKVEVINNKIVFTAPQSYADKGGVVELQYTVSCEGKEKTAKVFIYVMENCSFGLAGCVGSSYNVCLKEIPEAIEFDWYDENEKYLGLTSPIIPQLTSDVVFYARPKFNKIQGSPYRTINFPKGKLEIKVLSSPDKLTAKWTGDINTDWNNPGNWVQVLPNGGESPVTWAPITCVDVIIPNGAKRYPVLTDVVSCSLIHMEDRAVISGIHNLVYEGASVGFTPAASEKDRFIMWSAPLKDMYTGDYHFRTNNQPNWGHVYMNFFQSSNPDYAGSVEAEKTFTATFGSTGEPLPLGKAFNVKVLSGKEEGFAFPSSETSYKNADGSVSGNLDRAKSKRFIFDGLIDPNTPVLNLPVNGDNNFSLIQVVNPFMAYLNVGDFLAANSGVIERSYSIWNGDVNAEFITVLQDGELEGQRYVIDNESRMDFSSAGYIAPLQSFFVKKIDKNARVKSLTMNSATMTAVEIAGNDGSYVLRSAARGSAEGENILRIKASHGNAENSTAMLLRAGATQAYGSQEDASKVFNHDVPVSVYTLTDNNMPLAINVSESFEGDVKLGLRLRKVSTPVSLTFSGLSGFGQTPFLIDHELKKEVELKNGTEYVFSVSAEGSKDVVELNKRFSLRFGELPTSNENILNENDLKIVGRNQGIDISSFGVFSRVEVTSLSGMRVYDSLMPASYCRVSVASGQVYIVRVTIGDANIVQKVYVK